jgi:hypothetical protein
MLDFGDDPEVFERDRYGNIRQIDSASDADTILANFRGPLALMQFRLVYDGDLRAAGSKRSRARDKWMIRRKLCPQLAGLWVAHPTLQGHALLAESGTFGAGYGSLRAFPHATRDTINAPIKVASRSFVPLVRKNLELICELDILFLRNDAPGSIVTPSGGDLDNQIKTLFDGLRMPKASELDDANDDPEPFYCLLEDDSLISTFTVRTDRLLMAPDESEHRVLLVMEAKITALKLTAENLAYLTD